MSRLYVVLAIVMLQVTWVSYGEAARILVSYPPPAPSHFILGNALVQGLLKRGHQVTFINPFGAKKGVNGLEEIILTDLKWEKDEMQKTLMNMNDKSPLEQFIQILENTYILAENTLNNSKVQDMIAKQKFDLVILDVVLSESHVGFAHHFDCPVIVVSTMGSSLWVNSFVGNPANPSYVPQLFGGFSTHMSFMDRLKNTLSSYLMQLVYYCYHLPKQDYLLHKYFPNAPSLKEIIVKRTALVLLNSHPSISPAKPLVPNMIDIGGFHVDDPKPLPKDLKNYLDGAKQGFILFSMGSNLKSTMLPPETREAIMKVFSKLPYKILWKFEDNQLPGKPNNVRIEKWLPQNDILAHPNIKLFITHGGLLSTTETIYHGVPLVGIPVFGDQAMNMAAAEALGVGKTVHFKEISYEKLYSTVQEVLNNKVYRDAAKQRSALLRDQPLRPIDSAMYWIEYVLRHKYSDHLKTGAMYLTWYQEMSLDVLAFLGSIIFGIFSILYLIIKKCCCKSKSKELSEQKKRQ